MGDESGVDETSLGADGYVLDCHLDGGLRAVTGIAISDVRTVFSMSPYLYTTQHCASQQPSAVSTAGLLYPSSCGYSLYTLVYP